MSIRRKAAAVLAGAVLACGLLSAGTASAAAPTGHTRQAAFETYTVVPIVDAPVRSGPGNGHPVIGRLRAGYSYSAFCWLSGETVVDRAVPQPHLGLSLRRPRHRQRLGQRPVPARRRAGRSSGLGAVLTRSDQSDD